MSRWRDESGSATLLVLAMAGVLMLVGAAVAVVVAMVAAHRAAQSAADLSALAGARGVAQGRDGCARAAQVAAANRAHVIDCAVTGSVVDLRVEVAGPHWLGQVADLAARSRAGPAGPSP
jgi:secretion/DNA translocation related TadE-like protein